MNNTAIFCKKSGYILATSKGGRGSPLFYPLDPIIDYCPQKNFHNGEFGGNKLKINFDLNNLFILFTPFPPKSTIPLQNARIV